MIATGPFTSHVTPTPAKKKDGAAPTNGIDLPFYVKDLKHALARRECWTLSPSAHVAVANCCVYDVEVCIGAYNSMVGGIVDDGTMFSHICALYVSATNDVDEPAATNSLLKSFPRFVDQHCKSNAAVSAMGIIELATLALLLSSADVLPCNPFFRTLSDKLLGQQTRECLVSGLLVILNNQSKGQVAQQTQSQQQTTTSSATAYTVDISALRISLAVASLAYVLDGHTMADSLLTAANISQLLRLSMSKAVYPSPVQPSAIVSCNGSNNNNSSSSSGSGSSNNDDIAIHGMSQLWEIAFCRTALRRLLQIPAVLSSDAAVDEAFTFVSKWWGRLQKASTELSMGTVSAPAGAVRTPSKLSRYGVPTTAPADSASRLHLPVVPAVRTALEVVLDLHESLPQIRDYVRQTVCEGGAAPTRGLAFFSAYVRSVDPRTSHIAARLAARIVRDVNANASQNGASSVVLANDTTALLACACSHLQSTLATINSAMHGAASGGPLRDVTNTPSGGADDDAAVQRRAVAAVVGTGVPSADSSSSIAAASVRVVLLPVIYSLVDLVAACSDDNHDAWSQEQTRAIIDAAAAALSEICNASTLVQTLPVSSAKQRVSSVGSSSAAASAALCVRCLASACGRVGPGAPAELAAAGFDAKAKVRLLLADGGLNPNALSRLLAKAGLDLVDPGNDDDNDNNDDESVARFLRDCRPINDDNNDNDTTTNNKINDSTTNDSHYHINNILDDSQATRCTMSTFAGSTVPGANANATTPSTVRPSATGASLPDSQQVGRYADEGTCDGDESEGDRDPAAALTLTRLTHVARPRPPSAATVASSSSSGTGHSNGDPRPPSPSTSSQQLSSLFTPAHSKSRARHERTLAAVQDTDDTSDTGDQDDQGAGSDGMDLSDECGQRSSFLSPDLYGAQAQARSDHPQGNRRDSGAQPTSAVQARQHQQQADQLTQRLPSSQEDSNAGADSPSLASTTACPVVTMSAFSSRAYEHDNGAEMSVAMNGSDVDVDEVVNVDVDVDMGGMDVEGVAPAGTSRIAALSSSPVRVAASPRAPGASGAAAPADAVIDRAALLARVAMLESQATSTADQLATLHDERHRALRDAEQLQSRLEAACLDSAGLRAAVDGAHEGAQRQTERIRLLETAKARAESTAQESEERRSEAENLLQEAWAKLSALAKTEAARGAENRHLSHLAEAAAVELRGCQDELRQAISAEKQATGRATHLAASAEPLQAKCAALSSAAQELRDQLRHSKAQVASLTAQVASTQGSLEAEARGHEQCRLALDAQAIEAQTWRNRHQQEEKTRKQCESMSKDQQQHLEARAADVAKLQAVVMGLEAAVQEATLAHQRSREQCQLQLSQIQELEGAHGELERALAHWHSEFDREHDALEQQQRVAATLRAELKTARDRADAAQNELSKHRDLILYINKLSAGAEGEAGKATARRLSLALSQDHDHSLDPDQDQDPGMAQAHPDNDAAGDKDEECVEMAVDLGVTSKPQKENSGRKDTKADSSVAKRASRRGGREDGEGGSR